MVESALYTALSSAAIVTALASTRIYPLLVPTDSSLPAVDYSIVVGTSKGTFTTRGMGTYRVEVNCWGATYADAVNLRAAVSKALDGYTDGTITVRIIGPRDFFDYELLQYRAMVEFYVYAPLQ
jgi:hypothetical protein